MHPWCVTLVCCMTLFVCLVVAIVFRHIGRQHDAIRRLYNGANASVKADILAMIRLQTRDDEDATLDEMLTDDRLYNGNVNWGTLVFQIKQHVTHYLQDARRKRRDHEERKVENNNGNIDSNNNNNNNYTSEEAPIGTEKSSLVVISIGVCM